MNTITAPVWLWNADKGSWHFLTVPPEQAADIRFDSMGMRGGFGSVRVEARIGVSAGPPRCFRTARAATSCRSRRTCAAAPGSQLGTK